MSLSSVISSTRTVLLIADEALYIYMTGSKATKLIEIVPWSTQYFEDVVVDLLKKDCNGRPLVILNDMTDLHFKGGQRMPKVGVMDKKGVLDRKLQVAFPSYPIRGALKIKQSKEEQMAAATSGDLYLFSAIPNSDPIAKTMEAVKRSMSPIVGFFILPIEATDMVDKLSRRIAGKDQRPAEWAIFLGQHQDGSLRQVITRYGQLAMTRMTAVSDADANPDQWAADVSREFQATLSYLSRFGYSADKEIDVIVVANQEASESLTTRLQVDGSLTTLNIFDAAKELGLKLGDQVETRYADILHVAWCGNKSKFLLPMKLTDMDSVVGPRRAVAAATVLLLLGTSYLGYEAMTNMQNMMSIQKDIELKKNSYVMANQDYEAALQVMEDLGLDIRLIKGALSARGEFLERDIDFLAVLKSIGEALGNDLRLDKIDMKRTDKNVDSSQVVRSRFPQVETTKEAPLTTTIILSFPPSIQLEAGIQEVNQLLFRLREVLPAYDIDIVKQVARPEYTQRVSGVAGGRDDKIVDDDYTAELVLKGPMSE